MKKTFLFIVCLCFLFTHLTSAQGFRSGLMLGMNGSQITGDNMRGFDKGGLLTGVFSEYIFNELKQLRIEMNYTEKGSRKVIDPVSGSAPGTWLNRKISYLEVPVLYQRNAADWLQYFGIDNDHISLSGGLAIAYRVGEKVTYNDGSFDKNPAFSTKFEGSFLLGGDYLINDKFAAFIRYQSSLYDISIAKVSPFWLIWGERHKGYINVVTSIGLRYYFGKGN